MKNLNRFTLKQIISSVIHYLKISFIPGTHAVPSWFNKDLCPPRGKSSNLWSSGAEVISDGHKRWLILFKRTFPFYDLSTKGRITALILGLSLIFNNAFG